MSSDNSANAANEATMANEEGVRAALTRGAEGANGSAESMAVGNGAGEWPAQQPAMMPQQHDNLPLALDGIADRALEVVRDGGEEEGDREGGVVGSGEGAEGEVDEAVVAERNIVLNDASFAEMMRVVRAIPLNVAQDYLRTTYGFEYPVAQIEEPRLLFGNQNEEAVDDFMEYSDPEESMNLEHQPMEESFEDIEAHMEHMEIPADGTMRFEEAGSDGEAMPEVEQTTEDGFESPDSSTSDDGVLNQAFFNQSVTESASAEQPSTDGNVEVEPQGPSTSSDRRSRKRSSENEDDDEAPRPKRARFQDEEDEEDEDTEADIAFFEQPDDGEEQPEPVEEHPGEAEDVDEAMGAVEAPEGIADVDLSLANSNQLMHEHVIEENDVGGDADEGAPMVVDDDSFIGSENGHYLEERDLDLEREDRVHVEQEDAEVVEEEPMGIANPEAPIPNVAPIDEFPPIAGLDFPMPEEEEEGIDEVPADNQAVEVDENGDVDVEEEEDAEEDDDERIEIDEEEDEEEEEVAADHHVNIEDTTMADRLRRQLRYLISQEDIDSCQIGKLTKNAVFAALMEECSLANEMEDGVVLLHPDVYTAFSNGQRMPQDAIFDAVYFRQARWILVPMMSDDGTEHWSIACCHLEKRDLVVFDSRVPLKPVKEQRLDVLRAIMEESIGQLQACHLKYRYATRNRCIQEQLGEHNDDGIFTICHARRYLGGALDVSNRGAVCDIAAERQRLVLMVTSLRTTLHGFVFRPMLIPPPTFHLPPPPQPQPAYHIVRRDHRVTQERIRDCYRRLHARA